MRVAIVLLLCVLTGCGALPRDNRQTCLLPNQRPLVVAELFFGRNIPGREPLSDIEWETFAQKVIADNFPDGFTVLDTEGGWLDPRSGKLAREPGKLLIVAADPSSEPAQRIGTVVETYRRQFRQQSVGVVTQQTCAAFTAP